MARVHHLKAPLLEERVTLGNLNWKNRDNLKRLNFPRQTYAFSGLDWGDTTAEAVRVREKLVINGAPMFISPLPPGARAVSDEAWAQTYGASMDAFTSIFDGSSLFINIQTANNIIFPYNQGTFNAKNSNLYEEVGGLQQIQFITSKSTVKEAREVGASAGGVQEMRSLCIRGPVHIAGWGRTVTQRPTDPDPANPRDNDGEHKMDRSTWKVGPLDIRWDEKRACWRAFNDLIADDQGQNLGTWVYSTNPDLTCGFPFLRGKLEDVWSVRRTAPGAPLGKTNDTDKSGEVCTKIESLLYQDAGDLVAPWMDSLIVFKECNPGPTATCGAETTQYGQLGFLTRTSFYFNKNKIGPLSFTIVPPPDNVVLGDIYYQGDGPCGAWRPGIPIDLCEVGKVELQRFWDNDDNLGKAILNTCAGVEFNQDFIKELISFDSRTANTDIDFAEDAVKSGFEKIESWSDGIRVDIANEIAKSVFNAYQQLALNTQFTIDIMYKDLLAKVNECCRQIQEQLAINECCDIFLTTIEGVPPKIPVGALLLPDLDRDLGLEPEIEATQVYITKTENREEDIVTQEQVFDETPPSPVTLDILQPCPPKSFLKNNSCEIRS